MRKYPFPLYSIVEWRGEKYSVISSKYSGPDSKVIHLLLPPEEKSKGWEIVPTDLERYGIDKRFLGRRSRYVDDNELSLFISSSITRNTIEINSSPNIIRKKSILLAPPTIKRRILI